MQGAKLKPRLKKRRVSSPRDIAPAIGQKPLWILYLHQRLCIVEDNLKVVEGRMTLPKFDQALDLVSAPQVPTLSEVAGRDGPVATRLARGVEHRSRRTGGEATTAPRTREGRAVR